MVTSERTVFLIIQTRQILQICDNSKQASSVAWERTVHVVWLCDQLQTLASEHIDQLITCCKAQSSDLALCWSFSWGKSTGQSRIFAAGKRKPIMYRLRKSLHTDIQLIISLILNNTMFVTFGLLNDFAKQLNLFFQNSNIRPMRWS